MKSYFKGQLHTEILSSEELIRLFGSDRKAYYRLLNSIEYVSEKFQVVFVVPAGFVTDLASVPLGLRSLIDNDEPGIARPSVVHDYICVNEGDIPEGLFGRAEADQVMLEAMEVCGLPWWKRRLVYFAIRVGGRWGQRNT